MSAEEIQELIDLKFDGRPILLAAAAEVSVQTVHNWLAGKKMAATARLLLCAMLVEARAAKPKARKR